MREELRQYSYGLFDLFEKSSLLKVRSSNKLRRKIRWWNRDWWSADIKGDIGYHGDVYKFSFTSYRYDEYRINITQKKLAKCKIVNRKWSIIEWVVDPDFYVGGKPALQEDEFEVRVPIFHKNEGIIRLLDNKKYIDKLKCFFNIIAKDDYGVPMELQVHTWNGLIFRNRGVMSVHWAGWDLCFSQRPSTIIKKVIYAVALHKFLRSLDF